MIFKKNVILILDKRKHNEVCFRTDKKFSQKEITKKNTNGFRLDTFCF